MEVLNKKEQICSWGW